MEITILKSPFLSIKIEKWAFFVTPEKRPFVEQRIFISSVNLFEKITNFSTEKLSAKSLYVVLE